MIAGLERMEGAGKRWWLIQDFVTRWREAVIDYDNACVYSVILTIRP